MIVRSLVGLAVFNVFMTGVGAGALWSLRGWRSWRELVRLLGLAYLLGVALLGITLTIELVVGVPFSLASVVLTGCGIVALALLLRRPLTRWRPPPAGGSGSEHGFAVVAAVFGLGIVVFLEALFRAARLAPLSAWDAWAFWVPKAKAIYFFGGLDEQFFRELVNPTYPPLVPALEASAFQFMGSADVVSLHVQFWFFACGFVAAVAGLLAPRVPAILLWPFLLLVLVAPRITGRTLDPQADFLLDYFIAAAALLVALWLVDRQSWTLATASLFLSAAVLTKREGQMLTACIVVAALIASWRQWRWAWPRVGLAIGVAIAFAIPWRIWFSSRHLTGELPAAGALALFRNFDRGRPALDSVLGIVFDYDLWLVVVPLVGVAIGLAYLAGARILPTYALSLYILVIAGLVWVLWSFTEFELPFVQDESVNPIVRLSASLITIAAPLLPLLLDAAWRGADAVKEPQ